MKLDQSTLKYCFPVFVGIALALFPAPAGLPEHAWYFFAIFASLVVGLMLEPLPGAALGLIAISLVCATAQWTLFSPNELATQGFSVSDSSLKWALSGFSNSTVWLIFSAFMFALAYEKTGLGERISLILVRYLGKSTLLLGYAVAFSDLLLAPFTPSNTARSGGVLFPIIRHLPVILDSKPNDVTSSRRFGSYIMWVAIASTCVTSSFFLTGLAPNLLASELITKSTGITVTWTHWFLSALPMCLILLLLVPLLSYIIYPPTVKSDHHIAAWATEELKKKGRFSRNEWILCALMVLALSLWLFGGKYVNPTTAALIVICLMILTGILTWSDILKDGPAWNTLAWFATLVAMADGLNKVGFIAWAAKTIAASLMGFPMMTTVILLLAVYFFSHYLFASVTAHVVAMLPVMLSIGATIPGIPLASFALLLALTHGIMGIMTPYGTGPSPIYATCGYIPSKDFWRLGAIFGVLYFAVFILTTVLIMI